MNKNLTEGALELHFKAFRRYIIGAKHTIKTHVDTKRLIYADWIASGRLYSPIEKKINDVFGPMVANTHTESSDTGIFMTTAYHKALHLIKAHVNANDKDAIITFGTGMTAVVNKFQRILGLKYCAGLSRKDCLKNHDKPLVFITHMEHHSNHTSWLETNAEVVVIPPGPDLLVSIENLKELLIKYKKRKVKIGSFSACSNVTGIATPYHEMAALMHKYGGVCFVDFAASAPYVQIDMHPSDPKQKLDAIFFSPHKFLGGPGTSGVLIFDSAMYNSPVPDNPGGGTVDWTNPWGEYKYIDDIEAREDGGTPGFLQAIRIALCISLKEKMDVALIKKKEDLMLNKTFEALEKIDGLHILHGEIKKRLPVISFYIEGLHYNLAVRLLNDYFGIQVRGGCACAGTYGHYLLDVTYEASKNITNKISSGDLSDKPGWIRLSLHPTMSLNEVGFILDAIRRVSKNHKKWSEGYVYNKHTNEFIHQNATNYDNMIDNALMM